MKIKQSYQSLKNMQIYCRNSKSSFITFIPDNESAGYNYILFQYFSKNGFNTTHNTFSLVHQY